MTTDTWTTDGSGSWGDASNWSDGAAPVSTDDVVINVAGITVSVGTGVAAVAHTLDVTNSTLSISGGTLFTVENALFAGAFIETAGTYSMSGFGATFTGAMDFTGGTINVLSGAASIYDGSILAGTFTGAGALDLISGVSTINKGFACTLSSMVIGAQGGRLGFNTNFSYANNFTVLQNGVVDLFGHTLTLTGNASLEGTIGFGKIVESGTMTIGDPRFITTLDNGLTLSVNGVTSLIGTLALGASDSGAKIAIAKSGQFDIAGNWNIFDPSSVGTITNSGTFAKTGGGKTATVYASFASKHVVNVQIGTLLLDGLVNSLSGTVSGGGTLGIGGGRTSFGNNLALQTTALLQESGVLVLNKALSYAGIWDMQGGVLTLNSTSAVLTLSSQADFDGGTISGYGGTLVIDGSGHVGNVTIGGPDIIDVNGTLDQTNTITFGLSSNPVANIAAAATWLLEGDSSIIGTYGLIQNAGTFIDSNGSGNATIGAELVSTGTLTVNNSTLTLAGIGTTLSGTVSGSGLLDLQGTLTTLGAGVSVSVASLDIDQRDTSLGGNLSFANNFGIVNGGTLNLNGHKFALSGLASLDAGLITNGGTLVESGTSFVGNFGVGGTSELTITGTAEQTGILNLQPLSGPGTLMVGAAGTYTLDDDVNIIGGNSPGSLIVAGTFTAAGVGQSQIVAMVTDTGTIQVNDQLLTLGAGGVIAGSVSGAGTLALADFSGTGTYDLATGASLGVAAMQIAGGATAQLQASVAYGGFLQELGGGTIALGGDSFTLSGTAALAGVLTGPGVVLASGSTTLTNIAVLQGATLSVSGMAEQLSSIQVGDGPSLQTPPSTAKLTVTSAGQYTLDANASINGNGTLAVAGTLVSNGNGTSTIGATIVDTGTIAANLGTLNILGTVSGGGAFSIGTAGFLEFANTSTLTASNSIGFSAGGGDLLLNDIASFGAQIAGFAHGDVIELSGFNTATVTDMWNSADTQLTITDGSTNGSLTLTFTTAQQPNSITLGTLSGLVTLTHT